MILVFSPIEPGMYILIMEGNRKSFFKEYDKVYKITNTFNMIT